MVTHSGRCMAAVAWYWQPGEAVARDLFQKAMYGLKLLYFLTPHDVGLKLTAELGGICFRFIVTWLQNFSI